MQLSFMTTHFYHKADCRYTERRYTTCRYTECHYTECSYTECRGAVCSIPLYFYRYFKEHFLNKKIE
jgi:hypothetical protein